MHARRPGSRPPLQLLVGLMAACAAPAAPGRSPEPVGAERGPIAAGTGPDVAEAGADRVDPRARAIADLERAYGLTVATRRTELGHGARTQGPERGGNYDWEFPSDDDDPVLGRHLDALVRYWRRLPPEFVRTVGLGGILFLKNLRWNGLQVYGFEMTDRVVFVNLTLGGTLHYPGDDLFQYSLFHEFFHVVQNRLFTNREFIDYDEWDRLNPPGVGYHEGGTLGMLQESRGRGDFWALLHEEHPRPGFVSRYAMSDHWHDTTETFCSLLVTSRYRKAMRWAATDSYLRAKIEYLKAALARIHPGFTEDYFRRIHGGDG